MDFERLRRDRLRKVQAEMQTRDVGALLLTGTTTIRYLKGISVMPLWTASNLTHCAPVAAEAGPVIFEITRAKFRAEELNGLVELRQVEPYSRASRGRNDS